MTRTVLAGMVELMMAASVTTTSQRTRGTMISEGQWCLTPLISGSLRLAAEVGGEAHSARVQRCSDCACLAEAARRCHRFNRRSSSRSWRIHA
eukprot:9491449-Pyramimonas_sp.AAC.1